jgi:transmembrane sensor
MSSTMNTKPTEAQIAEAAAWVAHLHGAKRNADSDRGLQLWLKEDPSRARAWEVVTEVWDDVGGLQGAALVTALPTIVRKRRHGERRRLTYFAAAAAVALISAGLFFWMRDLTLSTDVGEQRTVSLSDGSQVALNTATRIVVRYADNVRRVELISGEARFDVARQPERPFVVAAGDRQVQALGTSFVVRHESDRIAVTLVEGKVAISADGPPMSRAPEISEPPKAEQGSTQRGATLLAPGQRLTITGRIAKLDTPALDKITAWQRGEIIMDGMRLEEAAAEMNRYSHHPVVIEHAAAGELVVSGVFRSGDSLSFANAVARTYKMNVVVKDDAIVLTGDPQAAYR